MSNRGALIRSRNKLKGAIGTREPKRPIFRGLTGDGTGGDTRTHVRVADEPTRMYVRVDGRGVLEAVVSTNVPMRHDVPVYIGPTQENLDVYEILGINFVEMDSPGGYAYVPSHHWSHEFGSTVYGADDVVWINKEQFLPFLAAPTDPPSTDLYAYPGFYLYLTDWQYFPGGNTGDLTAYNPAAGLGKYILISINAETNTLSITDGVAFAPFPPSNPATRIPTCPAQHFPLMAVFLLNTTATITWANLYDVRLMVGGGVNTEVPGPHHLIDTITHDDTIAYHPPAEGDMILANANVPPQWDVLAAAGASWRFLRSNAASAEWTSFDWDSAAGGGGDMVHDHHDDPRGGTHVRPYRLALQSDVQDMGGAFNWAVPWNSYASLTNQNLFDTYVSQIWNWDGAVEDGSIIFLDSDSDTAAIVNRTWIWHDNPIGGNIMLAGGDRPGAIGRDYNLGQHPLLFIQSAVDGNWYEIGWSGSGGGIGAHNVLSLTHGDSREAAVLRGAIIVGQVNHPFSTLEWTRLDYPGTRHHLQTDDLDVIWDEDVMMATTHWIGLGDASGYGTGEGRIAFYDMGLGRDVIANLDADVGVGTINPNIAGEAVAVTIESATGAPTLELSRLDDILPANAMVGVIRWYSGINPQCAQAQIDVVQTGYYEGQSIMEFWTADDCALCHVMDLDCENGLVLYSNESEMKFNPETSAWQMAVSTFLGLPGLRAFWPMSSVDYAAANRARDISGQGYHLTDNNTPTFNFDGLAPYVEFDGVNQYLSRIDGGAANWADVTGTETYIDAGVRGLTFGGWFYLDTAAGANKESLITKGTLGAATSSYMLFIQQGSTEPRLFLSDGAATNIHGTGASIGTLTWTFIVGKYIAAGPTSVVYINNIINIDLVGIPAAPLNDSAIDFNIGALNSASNFLDGRASLCFLCAAALSDATILAMYDQTRGLFGV